VVVRRFHGPPLTRLWPTRARGAGQWRWGLPSSAAMARHPAPSLR
jgi:hypothetical protein